MQRILRSASAALGVAVVTGALCVGAASPAAAADPIKLAKSCPNSYECVLTFTYSSMNPVTIDVDANGGVEQPLAVSLDYTSECHPTIYPSQPVQSFVCDEMYPGNFTARVYGGDPHDYYLALRWA